jgi:hypothetical protein
MSDLPTLRYVFFHEEAAPPSLADDLNEGGDAGPFWRDTFTDTVSHLLNSAAGDEIVPEIVDPDHPVDMLLRLLCEMPHIVKQGFDKEKPRPDPEPADQFRQQIEDSNLAYNLGIALRVGITQVHRQRQIQDVMTRIAKAVESPHLNIDEDAPAVPD